MTYIENVFICMVSPLLIAALCMGKKQLRFFLFCIAGMGACLFSAYINTFFAAITIAVSFATFENVCYLTQNGAGHFLLIFFRGFGTGAMHVICGVIVGAGLAYAWQRTWLKVAGTCGLLGAAITFHAIYNLLIAYGSTAQYIAYVLPVLLMAVGKAVFGTKRL